MVVINKEIYQSGVDFFYRLLVLTGYLVPDVDIPSDLASLIVTLKTMEYSAKFQSNITLPQYTLNVMPDLHLITRAPPSQRNLKPK